MSSHLNVFPFQCVPLSTSSSLSQRPPFSKSPLLNVLFSQCYPFPIFLLNVFYFNVLLSQYSPFLMFSLLNDLLAQFPPLLMSFSLMFFLLIVLTSQSPSMFSPLLSILFFLSHCPPFSMFSLINILFQGYSSSMSSLLNVPPFQLPHFSMSSLFNVLSS